MVRKAGLKSETPLELNERDKDILKAVVQSYISTAEPVGSRTVTRRFDFGLCSATIRNIMADLEEKGYLSQPHTSAGRVPTDKGYRFYVDTLIEVEKERYTDSIIDELNSRLGVRSDLKDLMEETSRMLSYMSHHLGVVLVPRWGETIYKKIEFIKLKGKKVLVIFITEEGIVQNRVIESEEDLAQRDLVRIAEFLNRKLKGLPLKEVKKRISEEMDEEKARYDRIIEKALSLYRLIIGMERVGDLYIGGMAGVFDLPDFSDVSSIKRLFKAIEDKQTLIKLLDRALDSEGLQVYIGSESHCHEMWDCSIITSTYKERERIIGTLGVIGPRRMNYREVISIVDYTARYLSRVLTEG
jgi:heat-inducible transcriptional repressor